MNNTPMLMRWDEWYSNQNPALFDLKSFETFINQNMQLLQRQRCLIEIGETIYLILPIFDQHIFRYVRFGLLKALIGQRNESIGIKR